jgi:hypothetical protein
LSYTNGGFLCTVGGDHGPDYGVYASTNLTNWLLLQQFTAPAPPFQFTDPDATNFDQRFYRVLLGP